MAPPPKKKEKKKETLGGRFVLFFVLVLGFGTFGSVVPGELGFLFVVVVAVVLFYFVPSAVPKFSAGTAPAAIKRRSIFRLDGPHDNKKKKKIRFFF